MEKYKKSLIVGHFEFLHVGHQRIFAVAKEMSEELVIGLDVSNLDSDSVSYRVRQLERSGFAQRVQTFLDIKELLDSIQPEVVIMGTEFSGEINSYLEYCEDCNIEVLFTSGEHFSKSPVVEGSSSVYPEVNLDLFQSLLRDIKIPLVTLVEHLLQFSNSRVLVIGDLILDRLTEVTPVGISREDFTMVYRKRQSKDYLGGAGIVAAHCAALGAQTKLISYIGSDLESEILRQMLIDANVTTILIEGNASVTNVKQRFLFDKKRLFRLNNQNSALVQKSSRDRLLGEFQKLIKDIDVIIFSDFSLGLFDDYSSKVMMRIAQEEGRFVASDCQASSLVGSLTRFWGSNFVSATEFESRFSLNNSSDGLVVLSQKMIAELNCDFVFLKLGSDGFLAAQKDRFRAPSVVSFPALNSKPVDVSGAGDAMLAACSISLQLQKNLLLASALGSLIAAVQVSREGNRPIELSKVINLLKSLT